MTLKALKSTAAVVLFALLLSLAAFLLIRLLNSGVGADEGLTAQASGISGKTPYPTVIIDAGHGGEDGGASGKNGTLEKDVNLDIALKLAELMRLGGFDVVLTREDDRMLYTENIKGKRKTQDLRNRFEVAKQHPDSVFVSIHANAFPNAEYGGLQVYYSPNDSKSMDIASRIQFANAEYLQPENDRVIKKADSKIYLLDRIETPAVMVECGFLTNVNEAELLASEDYRTKLASVIYKALCDYFASQSEAA